jgi:hypothetical protein
MFSLSIVYTPRGGRPLSVARISDHELLRDAAALALEEAQRTSKLLSATDPILGVIQAEEAAKLRRVLGALLLSEYTLETFRSKRDPLI